MKPSPNQGDAANRSTAYGLTFDDIYFFSEFFGRGFCFERAVIFVA
jgi:hypothetical protein